MRDQPEVVNIAAYTAVMYVAMPEIDGRSKVSTARYWASIASALVDSGAVWSGRDIEDDYVAGFAEYWANIPSHTRAASQISLEDAVKKAFEDHKVGVKLAERLAARKLEPPILKKPTPMERPYGLHV